MRVDGAGATGLGDKGVSHLHGTELKMLAAIERGEPTIIGPYVEWWATRMRDSARRAVATITISPHDRSEAVRFRPAGGRCSRPLGAGSGRETEGVRLAGYAADQGVWVAMGSEAGDPHPS
jgi:hypothetical protein